MYNNYQNYQQNQYSQPNQPYGYQQNPYYQQNQFNNQQFQQTPQFQQQDMLVGKIVDSIDVVRAINADLSGKANYYPKSDGTEIYCKRINPQTGASGIQTYVLKTETEQNIPTQNQQLTSILSEFKQEMFGKISEIKDLVLDNITKPNNVQNRGDK